MIRKFCYTFMEDKHFSMKTELCVKKVDKNCISCILEVYLKTLEVGAISGKVSQLMIQ